MKDSLVLSAKSVRFGFFLCLSMLLMSCGEAEFDDSNALEVSVGTFSALGNGSVIKSPNDRREYRSIVLDNQLKVILISDPETDKAAASVDVNSGSNSDPGEFEGLAHFLEHMLFLGTQKFPEAGEYQEFIASHGGSHNAYTAYENTNYYFDVDEAFLEPTLDRFAQFFIAPLFTPEYVDRERNAVHSEYQSNLQNDGRRSYAIYKNIINQAHPLSQFSVGSLETLQDKEAGTLRGALLTHYEENYSANMMSLALLGRESLDELELMVRNYFSSVENRNVEIPSTSEPIFSEGQLPALLEIKPVRDSRSLSFTFPIPVVKEYYRSKPLNYLGNVLGHEGEGSLLSLLKEKGWVNGLSAGGGASYNDNASFSISVSLTEAGVEQVDEISRFIFQFVELVKNEGVHEWLFNEQKTMAELSFRFQEPAQPISYVGSLSTRLQEYPPEELITASYAYEEFNAEIISEILDSLRPDNALLTLVSQSVETDTIEENFGGDYRYSELSEARVNSWQFSNIDNELSIAEPNLFLPEDLSIKPFVGDPSTMEFSLVNSAEDKPDLILDESGWRMWFKQDNEFSLPRANFYLYAMTPLFNESLENSLLSSFVVSLVNDKLNEYSYPANLAGVFYGVSGRARGFTLRVGGYEDKQQILLESLLTTLVSAEFEQERFDIIKAERIRAWQNASKQTPYLRLFQQAQALLVNPYWSEEQRISAVADISLDDVIAFVPKMLLNLKIDALYHGNVVEADALAMQQLVAKYLQTSGEVESPSFGTVVNLIDDQRIIQEIEIDHEDSAIVIYMQAPDDAIQTRAKVSMLSALMRTPFYDLLRTERQLGYVVNAGSMPILDVSAIIMYIESPGNDPIILENHINEFLSLYDGELAEMDQAIFDDTKAGLLNNMRQAPQRMSALSGRFWSDILVEEYEQDSTLLMANAIESITKEEVLTFYREYIGNTDAGRLVTRSVGNSHQDSFALNQQENQLVARLIEKSDESYQQFKDDSELYIFGNN